MTLDDILGGELADALAMLLAMISADSIAEIESFGQAAESGFVEANCVDGSSWLFNVGQADPARAAMFLATAAEMAGHKDRGAVH